MTFKRVLNLLITWVIMPIFLGFLMIMIIQFMMIIAGVS